MNYLGLGFALIADGQPEPAESAFRRAQSSAPGVPAAEAGLGWILGLNGKRAEALGIVHQLEELREDGYSGAGYVGVVYIGLGDHDRAIEWLERAYDAREGILFTLGTVLYFDPLRSDPRFQDLLRRMNLPDEAAKSLARGNL